MSVLDAITRFVVFNLLTVYYSILTLGYFAVRYVKNPFADPWAQKLRLEPPACLTDPKYGVHKYIKVNNVKLHYLESGDPSKPLMIFLHGFPEFWFSWRHQIVEFNKNYWCIAVDMRGYGDSERPDDVSAYHIDLLVEDVRDLVRQLGREKCILVSHDWGGLIACRFRDVHPDALDALVMLSSTSREAWLHELVHNPVQRKMSWYVMLYRVPSLPEKLITMDDLRVFDLCIPAQPGSLDVECYKYWFGKPTAVTPPINYYRANFVYTLPDKARCERPVPMLVANAADDKYLSHSILDRMMTEYAHIEAKLVPGCGHFIMQEKPEVVNKLVREFLGKHKL
ncbi:epoxide hydrolase 3-like [Cydia amplana]|uniref:epoxide hydrolase 3-like n=1 Tax=Cydia amplana TaxID=1869771 RepID=UPI002FE54168